MKLRKDRESYSLVFFIRKCFATSKIKISYFLKSRNNIKRNYEEEIQDMKYKWTNYIIKLSIIVLLEDVLSSYQMKYSSHYVQLLCLPPPNHMPCTHKFLGFKSLLLYVRQRFYSTVPYIQDGGECH